MKVVETNKSGIIGMAQRGELQIGEKVFSAINNQAYEVEKVMNHQGEWIGVKEVKNDG